MKGKKSNKVLILVRDSARIYAKTKKTNLNGASSDIQMFKTVPLHCKFYAPNCMLQSPSFAIPLRRFGSKFVFRSFDLFVIAQSDKIVKFIYKTHAPAKFSGKCKISLLLWMYSTYLYSLMFHRCVYQMCISLVKTCSIIKNVCFSVIYIPAHTSKTGKCFLALSRSLSLSLIDRIKS